MKDKDLQQQKYCPHHGKTMPCQSCQDIMNETYGMETPKDKKQPGKGVWSPSALPTEETDNVREDHYFDTSCQKCGHVPQGERHLCNWETPKEEILTSKEGTTKNATAWSQENETPKENWRDVVDREFKPQIQLGSKPDGITVTRLKDFIEQTLLTQRQEIEKWISENEYCSRCSSPKKFCKMWGTSPSAIDTEDLLRFLDLSERIEKGA